MTVLELIDACVQRRYSWWAMTAGSRITPPADATESFRRDALALLRQCRYETGGTDGGSGGPPADPDAEELRRQMAGLEWVLFRTRPGGDHAV